MAISPDRLKENIQKQRIVQELLPGDFYGDVYLVGGAIRELILSKDPNDYDFALSDERDLKTFEAIFRTPAFILGKKPIQTHRIVIKEQSLDITILKGTIDEDLRRRDFTINAIAYDVRNNSIIDALQGIEDIDRRIIRYPDENTIINDPLRMLKAARHFTTLQDFSLDNSLVRSITGLKHLINNVAPERIKYEMDLILTSVNVAAGMKKLEELGLLFEIIPELDSLKILDKEKQFTLETFGHTIDGFNYLHKYGERYGLYEREIKNVGYALLFHDLGKAGTFTYDEKKDAVHFFYHERLSGDISQFIMERLRFSMQEIKVILSLIENHMRIFLISNDESTEKALRRVVYKMGDLTPSLVVLTFCDMYGSSGGKSNSSTQRVKKRCAEIFEMYVEWKRKPLPKLATGGDLLLMGFPEGPRIGKCLSEIREKQIAGEITTRGEAMEYARERLMAERP